MILLYGYILYWILAAIGITSGYHRYFAHGGKRQHPVLEIIYLYTDVNAGKYLEQELQMNVVI